MADEVISSLEAGILSLTINRPDQRNALNQAVLEGLRKAFHGAAEDRAIRVIAITGAGDKVFCAGADLKSAPSAAAGGSMFRGTDYRKLLLEILSCPKPTVALARGHVMAGGMGILLACDLALACDDIHFSTPEILVGMFPMMVLALLLRHVGRKQATELLFLGERVSAGAAMESGIVNHVVPREQFEIEAGRLLRKLGEQSSTILGLGKKAIIRVADRTLPEDLDYLESALAEVMSSADSNEGIRAFVEKRKPRWHDE